MFYLLCFTESVHQHFHGGIFCSLDLISADELWKKDFNVGILTSGSIAHALGCMYHIIANNTEMKMMLFISAIDI